MALKHFLQKVDRLFRFGNAKNKNATASNISWPKIEWRTERQNTSMRRYIREQFSLTQHQNSLSNDFNDLELKGNFNNLLLHVNENCFNAKATSARKFLREFVKTAPYVIRSIQVDGGSEFMAEFETECAALNIPLIIYDPSPYPKSGVHFSGRWTIPPSKPKYGRRRRTRQSHLPRGLL